MMGKLAERFSVGVDEELLIQFILDLRPHNFSFAVVKEAIRRMIDTRDSPRFPPYAVFLAKCNEVRAEGMRDALYKKWRSNPREDDPPPLRRPYREVIEHELPPLKNEDLKF